MSNNKTTAKVICILDYLGLLCFLGLFIEKDDPDVRFHTNQGIILFVFEVIIGAISKIVYGLLHSIPVIGFICGLAVNLLGLVCLAFAVMGILNVVQGRHQKLPIIGDLMHLTDK